jgi:hypothetical protein
MATVMMTQLASHRNRIFILDPGGPHPVRGGWAHFLNCFRGQLHLSLGVTHYSVATILNVFFAGVRLAASYLGDWWTKVLTRRPFRSIRPPVPKETVHLFRFILATYSDSKNPLNWSVATLDESYSYIFPFESS